MSLGPDGNIFNFDGNGAYPDIINRSIAFSLNGTLDLLRSIPPGWNIGSISGILARGQLKIDRIDWNLSNGTISLDLTSSIDQQITIRVPGSKSINKLDIAEGGSAVEVAEKKANSRKVSLPAGRKVKVQISYDPELKPL